MLLVPVDEAAVPSSAVAVPPDAAGRHLLARGEATGHAHRVAGPRVRLLTTADAGPVCLDVPERAQVSHEEHGPIDVPAGWYQVVRQREYGLRVTPSTRTAHEGVAWTFGLTPEQDHPLVRT